MQRTLRIKLWLFLGLLMFPGASSHAAITVVSYWRLGENDPGATNGATATKTIDSVGTNNLQFQGNATYTNDVALTATAHTGSSLSVNFTNGAYATNAIVSTYTDNFGIECWVKPTALGGGQVIAYNGSTANSGWGLIIAANNTYEGLFGGATAFGTNVATANVWTHLALVQASGISTLYINGVISATNSGGPRSPGGNFALGAPPQAPSSQFFTGLIDEVRVFTFSPGQFSTADLLLNQSPTPTVTTTGPTSLTTNTATLNGFVNPNGLPTTAYFQWGPTQSPYYYTTAVTNLGSGNATLPVSQSLSGLTPGLTYHYRLVAGNAAGAVRGLDSHFWSPILTVNGNNPLSIKHMTWIDPGATVHAFPSEVGAGWQFSLALKADGTVVAWGDDSYGETNVPASATNVIAISAGTFHSLALKAGGTVVGWGYDYTGATDVPAGATNIVATSAGLYHSLALKADGTVVAWGGDSSGETDVPASATNVIAISAGQYDSFALRANGSVVSWGSGLNLGETNVPASATNVLEVSAGEEYTLALKAGGTVVGWGTNTYGQIIPVSEKNLLAISAGAFNSLALKTDGTIVGWGDDTYGQNIIPASATNVVAISVGIHDNLALEANGTVVGWGDDSSHQIDIPSGLDIVNLPVASSNNVDTNTPGSYQVNYFVTNSYGSVATTSRTVLVIDSPTITNASASLVATNATDGHRIMRVSSSVNPNGSPTIVSVDYGMTAGYGAVSSTNILPGLFTPQTVTIDVPLSPGFSYHWSVAATNGMNSIPGSAFSPDQLFVVPAAFLPGDINGDGIVDQSELNAVYSNYLPTSPWLLMTNVAGLGQSNVSFALSNSPLGGYSVYVSTDLVDWQYLGPATPRYLFTDTNAPAGPQRYYRLSYP